MVNKTGTYRFFRLVGVHIAVCLGDNELEVLQVLVQFARFVLQIISSGCICLPPLFRLAVMTGAAYPLAQLVLKFRHNQERTPALLLL